MNSSARSDKEFVGVENSVLVDFDFEIIRSGDNKKFIHTVEKMPILQYVTREGILEHTCKYINHGFFNPLRNTCAFRE